MSEPRPDAPRPDVKEMEELQQRIDQQVRQMEQADKEPPTMLAQTAYVGVLGLLFVLPVVGGAYLGSWLDSRFAGSPVSWTLNLILLGVIVGAANVYLFIRDRA